MKMKEVESLFFDYEEKRHEFLQKTQMYFLERGFQPYVWFDEEHRLRIKCKYRRIVQDFAPNKERDEFIHIMNLFLDNNDLEAKFILELGETNCSLPDDVKNQWSTEYIIEVKK